MAASDTRLTKVAESADREGVQDAENALLVEDVLAEHGLSLSELTRLAEDDPERLVRISSVNGWSAPWNRRAIASASVISGRLSAARPVQAKPSSP